MLKLQPSFIALETSPTRIHGETIGVRFLALIGVARQPTSFSHMAGSFIWYRFRPYIVLKSARNRCSSFEEVSIFPTERRRCVKRSTACSITELRRQ